MSGPPEGLLIIARAQASSQYDGPASLSVRTGLNVAVCQVMLSKSSKRHSWGTGRGRHNGLRVTARVAIGGRVLTLDPDHKLGSVTVRDRPALPPIATADGLGEHGGRDFNVKLRLGRREQHCAQKLRDAYDDFLVCYVP